MSRRNAPENFFFRGTGLPTVVRKNQPLVPRSNLGGKVCARTDPWFRGQTLLVPGHGGGGGTRPTTTKYSELLFFEKKCDLGLFCYATGAFFDASLLIFSPEKARVRHPLLLLSPCLGTPENLCDEVAGHRGSLGDVDVLLTPLPKGFIKEALHIINADRSVRVLSTMLENGWEGELI